MQNHPQGGIRRVFLEIGDSGQINVDDSFACPHCGAALDASARFCRECGADEDVGWSEETAGDPSGEWTDDDFDYDDYLRREFPAQAPPDRRRPVLIAVVVLLLLSLLMALN